jgi:hypothetical protein
MGTREPQHLLMAASIIANTVIAKKMAVRFKRCQIEDWEQEKIRQTAYRRP